MHACMHARKVFRSRAIKLLLDFTKMLLSVIEIVSKIESKIEKPKVEQKCLSVLRKCTRCIEVNSKNHMERNLLFINKHKHQSRISKNIYLKLVFVVV